MLFRDCMIAWTPVGSGPEWDTEGQVKVGPHPDRTSWSKPYRMSAGAAYLDRKSMPHWQQVAMMFADFHTLVVRDGIPVPVAHRAFLEIDEYRQVISASIPGAEADDTEN